MARLSSPPSTGRCSSPPANDLVHQLDDAHDPERVVIDMSAAHVLDASSVAASDAMTTEYERRGKVVEIVGLDEHSATMHGRLAGQLSTR